VSPRALSVVVDTNGWISGALMRAGVPAALIRQTALRARPVVTVDTFNELSERLWRPKFDRYISIEQRKRLLGDLNAIAHWVEVQPETAARTFCRDASDNKFIHAATAADAAWPITGDQDLLVLAEPLLPFGVRALAPAAALATSESAAAIN